MIFLKIYFISSFVSVLLMQILITRKELVNVYTDKQINGVILITFLLGPFIGMFLCVWFIRGFYLAIRMKLLVWKLKRRLKKVQRICNKQFYDIMKKELEQISNVKL